MALVASRLKEYLRDRNLEGIRNTVTRLETEFRRSSGNVRNNYNLERIINIPDENGRTFLDEVYSLPSSDFKEEVIKLCRIQSTGMPLTGTPPTEYSISSSSGGKKRRSRFRSRSKKIRSRRSRSRKSRSRKSRLRSRRYRK
jgi:hypothetical protein